MPATEPHYTILGLLGEGGFGRVYRARLEGSGGFSKDVAIKVLNDEEPAAGTLERFRDESRVLALVRDRAIVRVDPPVQLGRRWAIVMEYVEGATCSELLRRHRTVPPKVALEVAMEVARALGSVHDQKGPDGTPLELLHRDIKPANLAITASGEVKILDFGNARARFSGRESQTTQYVAGSIGFLAPERLSGVETAAGDVFSLGATMRRLVSAQPVADLLHKEDPAAVSDDPDVQRVLALVRAATDPDFLLRPSFRDLEARCEALIRELPGPSLRSWAAAQVPSAMERRDDALVGSVLAQSATLRPKDNTTSRTLTLRRGVFVLGLSSIPLLIGAFVVVVLTVVALVAGTVMLGDHAPVPAGGDEQASAGAREPPPAPPTPVPVSEPVSISEPVPVPTSAPEPAATPVSPTPPVPLARPRSAGAATAASVLTDLGSVPLGASIVLDGKKIGTTPSFGVALPAGRHRLVMELGGVRGERTITVVPGESRRYIWRGGDDWSEVAR